MLNRLSGALEESLDFSVGGDGRGRLGRAAFSPSFAGAVEGFSGSPVAERLCGGIAASEASACTWRAGYGGRDTLEEIGEEIERDSPAGGCFGAGGCGGLI